MAIPKVNFRKIERKSGTNYMLDYFVNDKRCREMVGKNKRAAEVLRSKKQNDLTMGKGGIPTKQKSISLDDLITEFLHSKNNMVENVTHDRYEDLFIKFRSFFTRIFLRILIIFVALKLSTLESL